MNSGKPNAAAPPTTGLRLSPRDRRILQHVGRHHFSLFDLIHRLFFPGQPRNAVKSVLRRLCGRGPTYRLLRPELLAGSQYAYCLTRRGAALLGLPLAVARPLGSRSRVEHFAILRFIHAAGVSPRTLLTKPKLREAFGIQDQPLPRHRFYIEETPDRSVLGVLVVDHGGHPRRIVRKSVGLLARLLRRGWFDDYLHTAQFVLTVLTPTLGKQQTLQQGLRRELHEILGRPLAALHPPSADGWPLPVAVVVIPGLLNLIPGAQQPATRRIS
ncbi:MAG: hypothetical protein L0Z62_23055 [Gemmataceae bacterium]|nr:hypothetical protein [Gemmataceae bacterium]